MQDPHDGHVDDHYPLKDLCIKCASNRRGPPEAHVANEAKFVPKQYHWYNEWSTVEEQNVIHEGPEETCYTKLCCGFTRLQNCVEDPQEYAVVDFGHPGALLLQEEDA